MPGAIDLNERQRAVVEALPGQSIRVLGGPGSGKTTTLIERAAWLAAQPGWSPDNVLVLAGNRAAATRLRDTLAVRIGATASGPIARTVASVSFHLVQAELGRAVTLLTGSEHDTVLAELLAGERADGTDGYWPEQLSAELRGLRGFRTELREFIMRTEEYGVTAAQLRELAAANARPEWLAVARFLEQSTMPQAAAHPDQFDAAQLTAFAARIVTQSDSLGGLEQVRAILIDDAQDATEATVSLLRAWVGRGVSVCAFGDPDVASNGFRGGAADLVGAFASELRLEHPLSVTLIERFHGELPIRQAVARVVQAIGTRGVAGHREAIAAPSWPGEGPHWHRMIAPSPTTEAGAIADELRTRHLLDGVPWSELAVVVRSARLAQALESTLARMGVPTVRNVSRLLLRDDEGARWLLDAAQFAYERADGQLVDQLERDQRTLRLLASPLAQLTPIEIRQLKRAVREAGLTVSEAFEQPLTLQLLELPAAAKAASAATAVAAAARLAETGSIEDVLWQLWSESIARIDWTRDAVGRGSAAQHANAALDAVVALFTAAKRFVERRPRERGTVFLAEQFSAAVPEDLVLGERARETVSIGTPSQFVGRSFDTVIIATLNDGVWPNLRPRFSLLHADELVAALTGVPLATDHVSERAAVRADEYRLFALALSRARNRVVLSAHVGEESAPSILFGDHASIEPRRSEPTRLRDLAGTMRRRLARAIERGESVSREAAVLRRLADAEVPGADPADWYGLTEWSTTAPLADPSDPATKVRVSPSAIEKLEDSALAWFVDSFAPSPPSEAQATGTIVHAALEHLGDREASLNDYVDEVLPQLDALPLPAEWMREQRERQVRQMLERLCQYLDSSRASGRAFVAAEARFRLEYGPIVVSGVIDRVERTAEGSMYVVDLKTGKTHMSVDDVKSSAQLECYQLAIHEGEVEGVDSAAAGGAALLYIRTSAVSPTVRTQDALDSDGVAAVRTRIADAAALMAANQFADFEDISDRGPTGARRYRIQVIPGVCS